MESSFESHVRPDGEIKYRIGHQLVHESLEFAVGRARPNTARAYAHDLSTFFTVVAKEPTEVTAKGRGRLRHRTRPSTARLPSTRSHR